MLVARCSFAAAVVAAAAAAAATGSSPSPLGGPPGPPPGLISSCTAAMVQSACEGRAPADCDVCVGQHQRLLRSDGCSAADVAAWCTGLPVALRPAKTANMVASPPSTLLLAGQTSINLTVNTTQPTTCRWGTASRPYGSLPHELSGTGSLHTAAVAGLSGTAALSHVYVRCAAFAAEELHLVYRSMPDEAGASYPRKGNLWGSSNFEPPKRTLEYAASHVDLWLGADWSAEHAAALRQLNPSTLVLTSINACEGPDGLPEELYLHNVTRPNSTRGRLESWPGAYRLDVTKESTQRYQAMLMYNLMLYGGLGEAKNLPAFGGNATMPNDGMFVRCLLARLYLWTPHGGM